MLSKLDRAARFKAFVAVMMGAVISFGLYALDLYTTVGHNWNAIYIAYAVLAAITVISLSAVLWCPHVKAGLWSGDGLLYAAAFWVGMAVLTVTDSTIAGSERAGGHLAIGLLAVLAWLEQRDLEAGERS